MSYKSHVLALADGGTSVTSSDPILQIVRASDAAVFTTTAVIPFDNTIPQNSEGAEIITLAITPKSATSILQIEFIGNGSMSGGQGIFAIAALFQDTTANALACTNSSQWFNQGQVILKYYMTSGTTSSTTFKVRVGTFNGNTLDFNGDGSSNRIYGGVSKTMITITELLT